MIKIYAMHGVPIKIGRLGENNCRGIYFPELNGLLEMYPDADVAILNKRPNDPDSYPVNPEYIDIEDGEICWRVQSGDLAYVGNGQCEVIISKDPVISKSFIYDTEILEALDGSGDPPDPWTSWQQDVIEYANLARNYADGKNLDGTPNPQHSENNAEFFSQQAGQSADAAEGSKNAVQNMTAVAVTLPAGSAATVTKTVDPETGAVTLSFGVPRGADGQTPTVPVTDVKINDTSLVEDGVASFLVQADYGVRFLYETKKLAIYTASDSDIKSGTSAYRPIVAGNQYKAVFYGLARAAGESMASSSNPVGTYTDAAKTAILSMLGAETVQTVSGSTPSIAGVRNTRYVCGECSTLSITPPASGIIDVVFESGSTPTVLTVPSTVKWPAWFDPTTLEANSTYELNILDGTMGAVSVWS